MDVSKISTGRNPPSDIHALIEVPVRGADKWSRVRRWVDVEGSERLILEAIERSQKGK